MNLYQFMSDSPVLTFFLALILTEMVVRLCVNLPNRILRHWNIHKHGYPPAHCDADGDFAEEKEMTTLKWYNVAVCHTWLGHMSKMQEHCKALGYPMFCWNGRIYKTEDCSDTGYKLEDVK